MVKKERKKIFPQNSIEKWGEKLLKKLPKYIQNRMHRSIVHVTGAVGTMGQPGVK